MQRPIALALAFILLVVSCSCYGPQKVIRLDTAKVQHPEQEHIVGITTLGAEDVRFDPPGGSIHDQYVHAYVQHQPYQIALSEVQRLWVERRNISAARTAGLTVGVVAAVAAVFALILIIAAAMKGSCPFVYSWDGERYVFDAEPYGGAIARGLERDDYAVLPHLRAQEGEYRLLLTNEVDETQYTNLTELWVIDHAPGLRVLAEEYGTLHTVASPEPPLAARDAAGHDLLRWLAAKDRLIWEPEARPAATGALRDEIVLTFPKPAGARTAKLVVNAGTALWGSYMIKEMQRLYGREVRAWRSRMEDPGARNELLAWTVREGLFGVTVEVQEPGGWTVRGILPGGGPVLLPDRIVPLDVSRARGDQLRIRLRPALGYWAFNSLAVDYSDDAPFTLTRVAPSTARDHRGSDVRATLTAADSRYYAMPTTEDRAFVNFPVPPVRPSMERTVLLHSRGWYHLHLPESGPADRLAIDQLMTVPDAGARFAADRFAHWNPGQ
jgi:hypothetical protein